MVTVARIGAAGGAPIGDLLWASGVATVLTALALWVAVAHRAGRIAWLQAVAARAEAATAMPGWSVLPAGLATASLLTACFGFYWDVAKHIDTGRDAGPFGTVAHYPILIGLSGITLAGFLAIVLGVGEDRERVPASIRLAEDWHAPLGGVLIFLCGALALTGFPLDDVWHTLFGQDVTLWGPTHILMVGGASLSVLGTWVLSVEGRRVAGDRAPAWTGELAARLRDGHPVPAVVRLLSFGKLRGLWTAGLRELPLRIIRGTEVAAAGGLLIGLSTLQGEFDYGVPQFQLVYQPVMIAFAAAAGLTVARLRAGRGAALGAAIFHIAIFGLMSVAIGPVFGLSTLHFPLYLGEAALVEAAALVPLVAPVRRHPLGFGALAGLLVGTVGVALEWGWSHVWMPLPWSASMLAQTAVLAPLAALAGGVLGAYLGGALIAGDGDPALAGAQRSAVRGPRWALPLAGAAIVACIAYPLPMDAGSPGTVTASLHTVADPAAATTRPAPPLGTGTGSAFRASAAAIRAAESPRAVEGTFRLTPASAADGAQWVQVIDWQGGGLIVDGLRPVAPGVFATTRPIPVGGGWKTVFRLANGRSLRGVPVYLPWDGAIPAVGTPASAQFTRPLEREKQILQREAVGGPAGLATVAYALLLVIVIGWLSAIVWGMRRMAEARPGAPSSPRRRPPRFAPRLLGGRA